MAEQQSKPLYALQDDQARKILDAVECAEPVAPETDYIMNNILWEELPFYFNGDKKLQDVLDIISSRVRIFLAEGT